MKDFDLSYFGAKAEETSRIKQIEQHEFRDDFQRDRDRILYSKEFRRLSGKTQIFVTGSDDNMRTRLTHTLEVAQIAETISKHLGLNTMLTVAIAYGHDVGHTPFGHIGERTLNYILNGCFNYYHFNENLKVEERGFKHNFQGVRVTSRLEKLESEDGTGLNLTRYTMWGIQNHTSLKYKECEYSLNNGRCSYKNDGRKCDGKLSIGFYDKSLRTDDGKPILVDKRDWTLEAIIVAYADEIAQRHHDIEDGIIAKVLDIKKLCSFILDNPGFKKIHEKIQIINCTEIDNGNKELIINQLSKTIVDFYVKTYSDVLNKKINYLDDKLSLKDDKDWKNKLYDYIVIHEKSNLNKYFGYEADFADADDKFSKYLRNHILNTRLAQSMDGKASFVIRQLVKAYLTNPQQLPDKTIISIIEDWNNEYNVENTNKYNYMTSESYAREKLKDLINKDNSFIRVILLRRICDYIAGMTDQFAMKCFDRLYGTKEYL